MKLNKIFHLVNSISFQKRFMLLGNDWYALRTIGNQIKQKLNQLEISPLTFPDRINPVITNQQINHNQISKQMRIIINQRD